MINKEQFIKAVTKYKEFCKGVEALSQTVCDSKYSIYETKWIDAVGQIFDIFVDSNFTDKGTDLIFYYLFENPDDKAIYIKQDKDIFNEEKEIRYPLDTVEELWNFLLTDTKLYFKNV
jgi:hypothetical protein